MDTLKLFGFAEIALASCVVQPGKITVLLDKDGIIISCSGKQNSPFSKTPIEKKVTDVNILLSE